MPDWTKPRAYIIGMTGNQTRQLTFGQYDTLMELYKLYIEGLQKRHG